MEVYRSIHDFVTDSKMVIALGNFDGVHIGHAEIIRSAVRIAKEIGAEPACYTFSNHPRNLHVDIANGDEPSVRRITSEEDKAAILEAFGIKKYLSVPFSEEVMRTPPERFISDVLARRLNAAALCCGFNYRFGMHAAGDVKLLREKSAEYGIKVCIHDAVMINGEVISSSAIRKALAQGNMEKCALFLGRPYSVRGRVLHSRNDFSQDVCFDADDRMILPPDGRYVSVTEFDGRIFDGFSTVSTVSRNGKCVKRITTHLSLSCGGLCGDFIKVNLLRYQPVKK